MAVVKANAYGHGAIEITRSLLRHGISRFAVVSIDEGVTLRQAGIKAPIVILGPLFPEQIADLLAHQLTPVVSDLGIMPIHFQFTMWATKKGVQYTPRTDEYTLAFQFKPVERMAGAK